MHPRHFPFVFFDLSLICPVPLISGLKRLFSSFAFSDLFHYLEKAFSSGRGRSDIPVLTQLRSRTSLIAELRAPAPAELLLVPRISWYRPTKAPSPVFGLRVCHSVFKFAHSHSASSCLLVGPSDVFLGYAFSCRISIWLLDFIFLLTFSSWCNIIKSFYTSLIMICVLKMSVIATLKPFSGESNLWPLSQAVLLSAFSPVCGSASCFLACFIIFC